MTCIEARLPDLGLSGRLVRATVWLASPGNFVERGEPLVEVTAGGVVVDIPAPASGVLTERLVAIDEQIGCDAPLATIDPEG